MLRRQYEANELKARWMDETSFWLPLKLKDDDGEPQLNDEWIFKYADSYLQFISDQLIILR